MRCVDRCGNIRFNQRHIGELDARKIFARVILLGTTEGKQGENRKMGRTLCLEASLIVPINSLRKFNKLNLQLT